MDKRTRNKNIFYTSLTPNCPLKADFRIATMIASGMDNRPHVLIKGRKYRVVTDHSDLILTFRGLDESYNPLFRHGEFPTQQIPWTAIERLEPMDGL